MEDRKWCKLQIEACENRRLEAEKSIAGYEQQLAALDEPEVREPEKGDIWVWPDGSIYFVTKTDDKTVYFGYVDEANTGYADCDIKFLLARGIFLCHIPDLLAQGKHIIGFTDEEIKRTRHSFLGSYDNLSLGITAKLRAALKAGK